MEKEIEDMISGNRWKQAYEVSELSSGPCPFGGNFETCPRLLQNQIYIRKFAPEVFWHDL